MYYITREVDGYIEKSNGNKYLVFAFTDKNKEVLEKYADLCYGIKNLIKRVNDKPGEYGKDFMKNKFNSDNNFPLNKIVKLHNLTVVVRSDFQEDDKYYAQFFF